MKELPDGLYPFIDQRLPLADMAMVEAPPDLEVLFKSHAAASGIELIRDEPVELRCQSEVRIPTHSGHRFRFEAGHGSDLKPATIPK